MIIHRMFQIDRSGKWSYDHAHGYVWGGGRVGYNMITNHQYDNNKLQFLEYTLVQVKNQKYTNN